MVDIVERLRILSEFRTVAPATTREAAEEIERLRSQIEHLRTLITELINAAADGGVMYQGITQRWWDAKEALRKAVGR